MQHSCFKAFFSQEIKVSHNHTEIYRFYWNTTNDNRNWVSISDSTEYTLVHALCVFNMFDVTCHHPPAVPINTTLHTEWHLTECSMHA